MNTFVNALEVIGQIDTQGRLVLENLPINSCQVKVIILYPDETQEVIDPDNEPTEEVLESLRQALKEARAGERISLAELWEEFEKD
jgi:hypothetical protein